MKKALYCACLILILLTTNTLAQAEAYTVVLKDKQFIPDTLKIKVGDSVNFKNESPYLHNAFSNSDIQKFDLGNIPKGKFGTVVFDKAGKLEVDCAIHPDMRMTIEIAN